MATFALIHGAGDCGWSWHLVAAELRSRGHDAVAPDLPCEDGTAGLPEFANTVIKAIGDREDLVVVGHSYGAFTASLVADQAQARARLLDLLAGMIPSPGEPPGDWWANTRYRDAVRRQAALDGGKTGNDDPLVAFYQDVPRPLAEEALRRSRSQSSTPDDAPWPLAAWPDVPTKFVLCQDDRPGATHIR